MASLALGLVGAGIGSLAPAGFTFLGMSGAGLGWAVGSALGNILFAPDGPNTQGPRLSDLSVQTSTRGAPIPKVYGTSRIAGNVIWTAGIQEAATTQDVGGKGGGGATHTSYTYSCSFAVGLCEGEIIGVRRIWADSVLIYDKGDSATADDLAVSNQTGITVYTGSETQLPDPTIEASEGVGNVPAHRGLAYVVFEDLQLERYGNRIPNVTFEVVASGAEVLPDWEEMTLPASGYWVPFYHDGTYYIFSKTSSTYYTSENLVSWTERTLPGGMKCHTVIYADSKIVIGTSSSPYRTAISTDGLNWTVGSTAVSISSLAYGNGVFAGVATGPSVVSSDGLTWHNSTGTSANYYGARTSVAFTDGVFVATGTTQKAAYSTDAETWSFSDLPSDGVWQSLVANDGIYVAGSSTEGIATSGDGGQTWTLRTSSTVDALAHGNNQYIGIRSNGESRSDDAITWTSRATGYFGDWLPIARLDDRFLVVKQNTDEALYLIDDTLVSVDPPDLSGIIADICSAVGVDDVDVTGVSDTVHGYVRPQKMTARSALEPLLSAYQCGAVESDYSIKFSPLTGSPADTIGYADLCGELKKSRDVETELPMRVTVSYADKDSDYLPAVQSDKRIYSTGQIVNEVSAQFALSTDASSMARLAQKILYRAWTEREKFDFPLTQKFAYLDAGDVVTINSDTATHVVRITNGQMGLPGLIECSGVATRASLYSSSVSGIASSYASQSLVLVGDTLFEIMDLPALRDADATTAGFYVAVYGERANWSSGIVYRSTDGGSSWSGLVSTSTEATMGVTTDALGDGDHKTWDETNTVNISMYNGTLSSDTTANVLNGANVALIGDELIHFRTATLEGDGTYTLSGLLRGMKGTEHETGTHAIGDRFVLLNTTSIYRVSADYSKLSVTDKFKAVTSGQFLDSVTDTTDVTFTNLNAKPLSPCQIYGTRDGSSNLTINWQRRSRLTETSLDDPGLGEASELYEVHVMSGGVAVRVIQSTTNSTTYTAAQQTADGLTPGDPVTVNIYQVSDTVGRGYVRSETI